jgi:hypothetical protein
MQGTGRMLSTGIATLILTTYAGNVQIAPENDSLYLIIEIAAFIVFTALCFAGRFVSLARGRVK